MRLEFGTLIIVATGAGFYWMLSGFRGTFNDYMSRYYESNSKYDKNFWTGIAVWAFIAVVLHAVLS